MTAITINVSDAAVINALDRIKAACRDTTPAMRAISELLARQVEDNFAAQAGPLGKWPALARSTIERRVGGMAGKRKGGWRKDGRLSKTVGNKAAIMKILQNAGRLAAAVRPFHSAAEAGVGVNEVVYAAIHQFGGQAGRNHAATIPARPYLPIHHDGRLQAGLQDEIVTELARYIEQAAEAINGRI
jgi:phage gpG-like protein